MPDENCVRIGTVSALDTKTHKARVMFRDTGITSDWLCVLQRPGAGVNVKESSTPDRHSHGASTGVWMPRINDTVLVLYLPIFNADGFVLGVT